MMSNKGHASLKKAGMALASVVVPSSQVSSSTNQRGRVGVLFCLCFFKYH